MLAATLDLAVRAAKAGGYVLKQFRESEQDLHPRTKAGDGTLVTDADKASSQSMRSLILDADPQAFILDEEVEADHTIARPDRKWIIDPLDGTIEFEKGSNNFCTLAAYVIGNTPVIGVMYFPMTNLLYYGGRELGVWRKNAKGPAQSLHRRSLTDLSLARMTGPASPRVRHIYERIGEHLGVKENTILDPSGAMYAALLDDKADVIITRPLRPSVWDVAAGHALLLAIGGTVVDLTIQPINYRQHTALTYGSISVVDPMLIPKIRTLLPDWNNMLLSTAS